MIARIGTMSESVITIFLRISSLFIYYNSLHTNRYGHM